MLAADLLDGTKKRERKKEEAAPHQPTNRPTNPPPNFLPPPTFPPSEQTSRILLQPKPLHPLVVTPSPRVFNEGVPVLLDFHRGTEAGKGGGGERLEMGGGGTWWFGEGRGRGSFRASAYLPTYVKFLKSSVLPAGGPARAMEWRAGSDVNSSSKWSLDGSGLKGTCVEGGGGINKRRCDASQTYRKLFRQHGLPVDVGEERVSLELVQLLQAVVGVAVQHPRAHRLGRLRHVDAALVLEGERLPLW